MLELLVFSILSLASLYGMRRFGVFHAPVILGPRRSTGVPLRVLLLFSLMTVFVWVMSTGLATRVALGTASLADRPVQGITALVVAYGIASAFTLLLWPILLRPTTVDANATAPVVRPLRMLQQLGAGLLTLVLAWPVVMLVGSLTLIALKAAGSKIPTEHDLITLLRSPTAPPGLVPLIVLSAAVAAPVFEELLFRGLIQTAAVAFFERTLRSSAAAITGRWAAILLTSTLFALLHPTFSWTSIATLSVALGYLYERTGKLLPCIVAHAGFNTVSLVLALLGLADS